MRKTKPPNDEFNFKTGQMNFSNVLNGLLTPLIAIIAVYIAFQQYHSNKKQGELKLKLDSNNSELERKRLSLEEYRVKLDLYNKRFRIFEETKKVLHKIAQEGHINLIELRDFRFSTNESKFLFDDEICQLLEELKTKAIELNQAGEKLKDLSQYPVDSQQRAEKIGECSGLNSWFNTEYDHLEIKFDKYLNFKNL